MGGGGDVTKSHLADFSWKNALASKNQILKNHQNFKIFINLYRA